MYQIDESSRRLSADRNVSHHYLLPSHRQEKKWFQGGTYFTMANEKTENQSVTTVETSDKSEKESPKGNMFERLFAPQSADTSVSSATDDDRSLDSRSNLSTLSGSSNDSDNSSCSSARSTQRFDRELRAKHKNACKNMTVSVPFATFG